MQRRICSRFDSPISRDPENHHAKMSTRRGQLHLRGGSGRAAAPLFPNARHPARNLHAYRSPRSPPPTTPRPRRSPSCGLASPSHLSFLNPRHQRQQLRSRETAAMIYERGTRRGRRSTTYRDKAADSPAGRVEGTAAKAATTRSSLSPVASPLL